MLLPVQLQAVHQFVNVQEMQKEKTVQDVNESFGFLLGKNEDFTLFSIDSCGKKGLACYNGGTCDEKTETCSCLNGFGGADCRAGIENERSIRFVKIVLFCFSSSMCWSCKSILL